MVRLIALILLCTSFNASAEYGEREHKVIVDIFHECQRKHYSADECRWAMQSNVNFTIPPFVICNLLNQCGK